MKNHYAPPYTTANARDMDFPKLIFFCKNRYKSPYTTARASDMDFPKTIFFCKIIEYEFFHNLYCRFPKEQYGKPYKVSNFFKRNKQIAIFSDVVIAFVTFGSESPGSMYTINAAKKLNKKTKVFH